jgi:hypothetical protein
LEKSYHLVNELWKTRPDASLTQSRQVNSIWFSNGAELHRRSPIGHEKGFPIARGGRAFAGGIKMLPAAVK